MSEYPSGDSGRFEFVVAMIALVLYGAERCLAFAFLESRAAGAGTMESLLRQVLFGRPPYSFLDVLVGVELNQGLFGMVQPINLLTVTIQMALFLVNYWIVRFPFLLLAKIIKGCKNQK